MITLLTLALTFTLAIGLVGLALPIADRAREIAHRTAIDVVEVVAQWQTMSLDSQARRAKLDYERGRGRLELTARRFELLELPGRPELPEEVRAK